MTDQAKITNDRTLVKTWFFIAIVLGLIFLIYAKEISGYSVLSMIIPVGIMLLYLAFTSSAWYRKELRKTRIVVADSFYYMGFIFTMMALAVSMYRYGYHQDIAISLVLTNLGISLTTTIAGFIGRVLLIGFQDDVQAEDIVDKVADKVQEIDEKIVDPLVAINQNSTDILETLSSSMGDFNTNINPIYESLVDGMQGFHDNIDVSQSKIAQSLEGIGDAFEVAEKNLALAAEDKSTAILDSKEELKDFADAMHESNKELDLLKGNLLDFNQDFQQEAITPIDEYKKAADNIHQFNEAIAGTVNSFADVVTKFDEELIEANKNIANDISEFGEHIQQRIPVVKEFLQEFEEVAETFSEKTASAMKIINNNFSQAQIESENLSRSIQESVYSMQSLSKTIQEHQLAFAKMSAEQLQVYQQTIERVAEVNKVINFKDIKHDANRVKETMDFIGENYDGIMRDIGIGQQTRVTLWQRIKMIANIKIF